RCYRDWSSDVCSSDLLEVAEKAPRTSLLMKNKLQYRPGKETHNPEQKRSCFFRQRNSVITTVFIFLSSFCLNLLALTPPEGVNRSEERRVGKECRHSV